MIFKKLEKKMTIEEARNYIKNHPKWRLPTSEESKKLNFDSNIYYFIDRKSTFNATTFLNGNVICNVKFKNDVVLVPALDNVITSTAFTILSTEITEFDFETIKIKTRSSLDVFIAKPEIQVWDMFDTITKDRIYKIFMHMKDDDVLVIKNNERNRHESDT